MSKSMAENQYNAAERHFAEARQNDWAPYPLNTAQIAVKWFAFFVVLLGCLFLAALLVIGLAGG